MPKTKTTKKEVKKTGKDFGLTPKETRFCELWSSYEEFFGNGTQSYIKAYSSPKKKIKFTVAQVEAYHLLRKPKICEYINYLLELSGLNDEFVDKQLNVLLTQNADFKSKLGAIREYNTLKKRVEKNDINIILPTPIYGGSSVSIQGHPSNQKDISANKED